MMRTNPSTSMQKTYDECFLTCSTAVYFESQGNEAEALRSWKGALDQIYYHNAYRVPSTFRPRNETERALQESLRQLELQCKERVDLLEALKRSREESAKEGTAPKKVDETSPPTPPPRPPITVANDANGMGWMGGGTIPPVGYGDLHRPSLSIRPALPSRKSSSNNPTPQPPNGSNSLYPRPSGPRKDSRTPSPEKKGRMLRTLRPGGGKERASSSNSTNSSRPKPPAAAKAATLAFGTNAATRPTYSGNPSSRDITTMPLPTSARHQYERPGTGLDSDRHTIRTPTDETPQSQAPFYFRAGDGTDTTVFTTPPKDVQADSEVPPRTRGPRNDPSAQRSSLDLGRARSGQVGNVSMPTYRNEYPAATAEYSRALASSAAARSWTDLEGDKYAQSAPTRKPVAKPYQASPSNESRVRRPRRAAQSESLGVETSDSSDQMKSQVRRKAKAKEDTVRADLPPTPTSEAGDSEPGTDSDEWKEKCKDIMKNLPKGVDEGAAKQILNEIVIKGDEVHWDDIAGLEVAKYALKETVVYPFLRPDLFMGLREPARGMLLFGPPGTGKTMLARGVATESRSTFFAISASSLTSKFLGESEKLVRALFALAKMLAPSIIFVDEIDSLLSSRSGSGEHEATRRIKTEFLIQWSDLAKAAAGREQSEKDKERGDASRVLVLAATNLPWAIDEAARRRFVRRQYIPLPEGDVRKSQLKTLLSHQKHELSDADMDRLVALTDGFSGSDITALAKDAAMGPLRSLGEKLLHMTMDEIRPMRFEDFQASLVNIRPSVSGKGLKEYEDWAREFGERGG